MQACINPLLSLRFSVPWPEIHAMVNGSQAKKIILFLRHGQAYENLAPGGNNKLCNFTLHGAMVQNWDSALTKTGLDQAAAVHSFLLSKAVNQSEQETW